MISLETFIEKYNERIGWNKELRSTMNIDVLEGNPATKRILGDYLNGFEIMPEDYELETAKIYKYEESNTYELQIYSFESYHTVYFWCDPDITKDEYIKERVSIISREAKTQLEETQNKIKELESIATSMNILLQDINKK